MKTANDPIQELGNAITNAISRRLLDVKTSMPGIVESYDSATQTAEVTVAMKRIKVDGSVIDAIKLPNVRVQFQKTSETSVTYPLKKGDEVLLVFNERDIDAWRATGSVGAPQTNRRFSLTDVVAIPGYVSDGNVATFDTGDEDNFVIKFKDIKIVITSDGKFYAGKVGGTQDEPLVLGNVMLAAMTDLITQSKQGFTAVKTGPVGIGNLGQSVPTHPTLIAALTAVELLLDTTKATYVDTISTNIVSQIAFTERGP